MMHLGSLVVASALLATAPRRVQSVPSIAPFKICLSRVSSESDFLKCWIFRAAGSA